MKNPGRMSIDLYRKIVDEAAEFAIDINIFGRGEAFLHPELPEFVRYAHDKGLNTRLETNATVLTPEKSEAVIRAELDFISFSFDGYSKETYESIRRGADFEKTLDNIVRFLEVKKALRLRKPYVSVQFIRTPKFLEGASKKSEKRFKAVFRGLPINAYRYVTPHRYTGEIDEAVTGTTYGYVENKKRRGLFLKIRYTPCPYLWYSTHILWDGTVTPCCMDFHSGCVLGDVSRTSIRDIWNGEAIIALRRKIGTGDYRDIPLCSRCDMLNQVVVMGISTKNIRDFKIFLWENLLC
jgi:MoaA/NifB/PqqE/SkfB family radical SAM enzyme